MSRQDPPLFFVHVMKTAGTTFFFHLRAHFGPNWVFPEGLQVERPLQRGGQLVYFETEPLLALSPLQISSFKAFAGHYPFVLSDMLGVEPVRLTILRDPVERTLSFLRHAKQHMPEFADATAEAIYASRPTFESFIWNHQTKVFSMDRDDELRSVLDAVEIDDRRYAAATANLERVDLLGLQEDFESFMEDATARFGIVRNPAVEPQRVGAVDLEVPDALRARIATDNAFDVELYQHAVRLHRARKAAGPVVPLASPVSSGSPEESDHERTPLAVGERTEPTAGVAGSDRPAEGPEVFFIQVLMTAGGAVNRDIRVNLGGDHVYPFPAPQSGDPRRFVPRTDIHHLLHLPADLWEGIRAVSGHFPYVVSRLLGWDMTTMVVLRDPVERIIDQVRNRRDRFPDNAERTLADVYDDPRFFASSLHNHQAKLFAMTPDDPLETYLDPIEVDGGRLEVAKANLATVDLVGLTERFDDFRADVADRFGWTMGPPKPARPPRDGDDVPAALRARIVADNAADLEFYEFACRLVDQRAGGGATPTSPR